MAKRIAILCLIPFLVLPAAPAPAAEATSAAPPPRFISSTPAVGLETALIRGDDAEVLLMRAWLAGDAPAGFAFVAFPAGAELSTVDGVGLEALRFRADAGHRPLGPGNGDRGGCGCEMVTIPTNVRPLRLMLLGTGLGLDEALLRVEAHGLVLDASTRAAAAAAAAGGALLGVVAWDAPPEPRRQPSDHPSVQPLPVLAVRCPGRGLPVPPSYHPWDQGASLTPLVGAEALVSDPEGDEPGVAMLLASAGGELRTLARRFFPDLWTPVVVLAGAGADPWQAHAAPAPLRPRPLDPAGDLRGGLRPLVCSLAGREPTPAAAAMLREALADTSWGAAAASLLWAWGRQDAPDRTAVARPWCADRNLACRTEASAIVADGGADEARDALLVQLADAGLNGRSGRSTLERVGARAVALADRSWLPGLRAVAARQNGWRGWQTLETGVVPGAGRSIRQPEVLDGSQWAVAALARAGDPAARRCLVDAVVQSALRQQDARRDGLRGCSHAFGITTDFWNGALILEPQVNRRLWLTLDRVEFALAPATDVLDTLLRTALDDPQMTDEAATVILATLRTWTRADAERARALARQYAATRDRRLVRFVSGDGRGLVDVPLPAAAAGAVYVLAQRGEAGAVRLLAETCRDVVMRGEIVFALALVGDEQAAPLVESWIGFAWGGATGKDLTHRRWAVERYLRLVPAGQDIARRIDWDEAGARMRSMPREPYLRRWARDLAVPEVAVVSPASPSRRAGR